MTGPVDQDVPLLGLGRDQVQAWTQFMLVTANAVRQYRVNQERAAWSQEWAAARATQRYSNDLDPWVRAMVEADESAFQAARRRDPSSFEDKTSGEKQFGWVVHTTTGPMPEDSPSGMHGAWGLWADGWLAEKKLSVFVVADKETALRLRDEVTEGEQRTLKDLGELGTYGHMRAVHARTEVREEPWQLRVRVWGNLCEVWPNDFDLAAAVMTPSPYWNGDGGSEEQRYGAIDRLATRLRGLEDRGYSMTDVVRRLDLGAVRQQYEVVEWHLLADFVDRMVQRTADQLQVVDADPVDPVVAREVDEALDRGLRDAGVARDGVLRSEYFDQLRAQLTDLRFAGRDLDALLADLPAEKISQAQYPAAYLRAVVEERARSVPTGGPSTYEPGRAAGETAAGIHRSGSDLGEAERMIRRHFSGRSADAVISCRAWPGLAKQLLVWKEQGAPIAQELTQTALSVESRLSSRKTPASYVKSVLRRGIEFREHQAAEAGESERSRRDAAHAARVREASRGYGASSNGVITEEMCDGVPEPPFDIYQLDPTNAVDRAALEMARGAGTVEDDDYIEQILLAPDPGEVWMRFNRADGARGRADQAEEWAEVQARTLDDPDTRPREELIGQAEVEAGAEQRRADRDRALAHAEETGAPTAAALRVEVAHRPPSTVPDAAVPDARAARPGRAEVQSPPRFEPLQLPRGPRPTR
ncbi:hypothetical protein Ae717Ps2_5858c [Pseudonocardia sp. Ae717_Ps2]|uniref:hypothetical protein n=1 Tax=Pseudonocardia sp. Ae717_Ps2 TaxID=1885573 RepID=UPI00094B4E61|nr:hypothetical protein [Pseudonocardia sp. Ae717_Ps2]OLM29027.1 hypothetical protein Ae717Ps2_5783c [Pseudonocardia sp. Ae717_Ps2]OLM29102.1 hypothetical protein Ae717Ps2_5858c [Pseudonocardia sp. Ae717_Ps2]